MDKEEFRMKLEEINHLVENEDYKGAMNVVDSIDWRRVKNVRTLCVVGEIYSANKRYEDSKEIFLLAYHRAPIGKNILCRLIEISLKVGDVNEAMEYYEEYIQIAPNDSTQYILKYKIYKARNASTEELIRILEQYKNKEFTEKWSYELAKLYYKVGDKKKCLDLCNEIVLWFSDGKYVLKALDLKKKLGAPADIIKNDKTEIPDLKLPDSDFLDDEEDNSDEEETSGEDEVSRIENIPVKEGDVNYSASIQEKISRSIRDIFNSKKKEESDSEDEKDSSDEIQEEMLKDISSEENYDDVPELEPEGAEPNRKDFPLDFDQKKKKKALKDLKKEELEMPDVLSEDFDLSEDDDKEEEKDFDFNLEDTILAAATAQGIEIPGDEEKASSSKKDSHGFSEEEEELTEEDLQKAEEEFLNGPSKEDSEDEAETEEEELEKFIESIQPENQRDPMEIVSREKALNEYEKKLFTYFVNIPGMKEQLIDVLCDVQMAAADKTSKTGNVIVMGGKETGKTRLISALIPAICKELRMEASKVAYVFAEQINDKDVVQIVQKLSGGFFVIENANQLSQNTIEQLDKAMEFRTDGLTVILEDEKIGMRKLIAKYPKFAKKFTSMINIPVFTNDELVSFAKVYTKENGYRIDQMGLLALYNLIGENQKEDEPMNIGAVKELVDAAIAKSQGGIRKLKRNISKKHTDHDGYVVLYEKDFS